MIDLATLRTYLAELGDEITRGLGLEEVALTIEPLDSFAAFTHDPVAVDWVHEIEHLVPDGRRREDHVPIQPFGLSRDDLHLIDAGLKDVVGHDYRAYPQTSGRRPAIWRAFLLEGARGRYQLELWRCD